MPGALNSRIPPPNQGKRRDVDVVFLHDATGSQQPYLDAATQESRNYVKGFADELSSSAGIPGTARFRVVAFRDHREQGDAWTIQDFHDFTTDPAVLEKQFRGLVAEGGGDGPEAQLDALDAALRSPWSLSAKRIVFLITDSPPHGVEPGDKPPPSHAKSLTTEAIVANFKTQKIKLFVIGCTPTIENSYKNAVKYYKKLVKDINQGGIYRELRRPGADTGPMKRTVVGSTLHASDVFHMEDRWEDWIKDNHEHGHEAIASTMHEHLTSEGHKTHEFDSSPHVSYVAAPTTRARVDDIVSRTLEAHAARMADPIMASVFDDDDDS
ncbi:VWFA domain-containing protein [Mycena chlorophos]|uniref:VWFA domain-containing protein n=2 Tax=Mycena chlorophos TaxID=658473 RepID=A0A146ICU2_MYCCL|nr:VWFA domain-containing protein [Mycena chlorophos]GAT56966.1 predicted protein [Mycena chlorophos]